MSISVLPNVSSEFVNVSPPEVAGEKSVMQTDTNIADMVFDLGLWLSGLQSFLRIGNYTFAENKKSQALQRDWTGDFHLTNTALLTCSRLALRLAESVNTPFEYETEERATNYEDSTQFDFEEVAKLTEDLKNLILINRTLLRAKPLQFGEWMAWSKLLAGKLEESPIIEKIINITEEEERYLPEAFLDLLQSREIPFAVESDFKAVLPRISKILRRLDVIEDMLVKDAPLKPAQLLFSKIYEQTQEMIGYINNRLLRFPDETGVIFDTFDCAVYAAAIELQKVYKGELAGWSEIANAPHLFAKTETAHSLLSNSFRQTLVSLAQVIDPEIQGEELFPAFRIKLEQSLSLRENLWQILCAVRDAEKQPEKLPNAKLNEKLTDFTANEMNYLMTKDCETFERFVEEIVRTSNSTDLVPTLHRFGAYTETLLGQVNMRTVLADKPFDYPECRFE